MLLEVIPARTLVGVLRGSSAEEAYGHAAAAIEAGLKSLEVTFTLPGAVEVISRLRREYGGQCRIGAGTVVTTDHVTMAADAGAEYLVSPHLDLGLVASTQAINLPYVPGVMTPSELREAVSAGCSLVKVFPIARMGGPAYLSDLQGPFPGVQVMATGGVTAENAIDYFTAGASAVGLGSIFGSDWQGTAKRTARLMAALSTD